MKLGPGAEMRVPLAERHTQHEKFATAFRKRYRDNPEAFHEAAQAIRDMVSRPGWDIVMEIAKEVHDDVNAQLVNTWPLPELEVQARWVGEMKGLQELLGIAQTFDVIDRHEMAKLAEIVSSNREGG